MRSTTQKDQLRLYGNLMRPSQRDFLSRLRDNLPSAVQLLRKRAPAFSHTAHPAFNTSIQSPHSSIFRVRSCGEHISPWAESSRRDSAGQCIMYIHGWGFYAYSSLNTILRTYVYIHVRASEKHMEQEQVYVSFIIYVSIFYLSTHKHLPVYLSTYLVTYQCYV